MGAGSGAGVEGRTEAKSTTEPGVPLPQALGYCPDAACAAKVVGAVTSIVTPFTLGVSTNSVEVKPKDFF